MKKTKILFFLIIVSFITVFLANLIQFNSFPNNHYGSDDYDQLADNLINFYEFTRIETHNGKNYYFPVLDRVPLYSFTLGVFKFFFYSNKSFFFLNILLFILGNLVFYKILKFFFSRYLCFVILIIFSSSPLVARGLNSADPQILSYCLFSFYVYFLIISIKEKKFSLINFFLVIFFSLLLLLTRHNYLFFVIPSIFFLYIYKKEYLKLFISFLIIFFIIFLWSFRNYSKTNYFNFSSLLSSSLYIEYVVWRIPLEQKKINDNFINDLRINYLFKPNPKLGTYFKLVDEFHYSQILLYIKNYPEKFMLNFFKGIYAMHGLSSYPTKHIILSKIYNFDYPQDGASIAVNLKKKQFDEVFFVKSIFFIFNLLEIIFALFLFLILTLHLINKSSNINLRIIKLLSFSTLLYIIFSGIIGGIYYAERGLVPVFFIYFLMFYNFRANIEFVINKIKKKFTKKSYIL
jgi:hypothetical protein